MARALVIQLARLGDLLQSLPAIAALRSRDPEGTLDLLCPKHLAPAARLFPGIAQVLEWDGPVWRQRAEIATPHLQSNHVMEAERHLQSLAPEPYDCAYVLNQHPRALLAGALLARETKGPRVHGPLDEQLTPWASYVRDVARTRRGHRVHLADALCGLCGLCPPGTPPAINFLPCPLPSDIDPIGKHGGPWIGLIVGAGETERLAPIDVWRQWITRFLRAVPRGRVVLVGQERERGEAIQETLPPSVLGRIWDATGRTALPELATILARCHTVIGADTGPLHLAAAVGTKVIGWYFARARVHETGPYGEGHWIWQAEGERREARGKGADLAPRPSPLTPHLWPIPESVELLLSGSCHRVPDGWSLWTSHCDRWGAYYTEAGQRPTPPHEREGLWRDLQPALR